MRIVIVGAGQVGSTIVEALHGDHELTVIDVVRERLEPLAYRFDVRTVEANGASRQALQDAGVDKANLFIACTSRDEVNLVACSFARVDAPKASSRPRTPSPARSACPPHARPTSSRAVRCRSSSSSCPWAPTGR
jgi:Trk K+ transport system NAD-binding subunit